MKKGDCRLCLERKDLCEKSHIISGFMYREIFDEKNRLAEWKGVGRPTKIVQSGTYEGGILCKDCDNKIIGQYETYAKSVLYDGKHSIKTKNCPGFMQIKGLNYKKFKLFLLSLLWRTSISSKAPFKEVDLGPYEEKLRRMILEGNPGYKNSYPCIIVSYRNIRKIPYKMLIKPRKTRIDNIITYIFTIAGFFYFFKIIESESNEWILDKVIDRKGQLKILHTPKDKGAKMINSLLGDDIF